MEYGKQEGNMKQETVNELLEYIHSAATPYQAVIEGSNKLRTAGFQELNMKDLWELQAGGSYFVMPYATSLFAFTIGDSWEKGQNLRIAAAHTDHPGFRVKPNAEMISGEYLKLDTETYGGPILNTWMDRPLSIAGRVAIRSEEVFRPTMRIIDVRKPVLTIPNLPIHINRDVNKGVELNRQTDMLPIMAIRKDKNLCSNADLSLQEEQDEYKKHFLTKYLAEYLKVKSEDILDYDIYLYNAEEGCVLGLEQDFISSPRLDNLTSVLALLNGIMKGKRRAGVNLIALYDNEEIGSKSKQGADSSILNILLEKIYAGLGINPREELHRAAADSMLLSVDVAHAVHPNRPERYDPNNQPSLNGGVVIKIDSNQKYTFDTEAVAIVQQLCEQAGVKYQKYVNRSDMPGGSTLGPIISSWLPIKTVDLGVPLLAMHSAREMMGAEDQEQLELLIREFFQIIA